MKRLLALVALAAGAADAQQAPIVQLELEPDTVIVGESVRLRVTVLVPTWFAAPPVYPDFEIANAITTLPADSSFPTSRRIGGETWSGIVRDYRIVPLAAARYRQDDATIRVATANPGGAADVQDVAVPAIEFRAAVPAGAEALDPYIAGTKLEFERKIDAHDENLEAGDAVVLRYEARLDGLPAIFLPPLVPDIAADGLAVYADEPRIDDGPPAVRRETVTLVFETGGEFTVPPQSLSFWNTASGRIESVSVDALTLTVTGPALEPEGPEAAERPFSLGQVAAVAVLLLLSGTALHRSLPSVRQRWRTAAERRRASEARAFRQLEKALLSGNAKAAYAGLITWLARLAPSLDSRSFAAQFGNDALVADIERLIAARYGADSGATDTRSMAKALKAARRRYLAAFEGGSRAPLAPLNPC